VKVPALNDHTPSQGAPNHQRRTHTVEPSVGTSKGRTCHNPMTRPRTTTAPPALAGDAAALVEN
jgi:hypothetical protein